VSCYYDGFKERLTGRSRHSISIARIQKIYIPFFGSLCICVFVCVCDFVYTNKPDSAANSGRIAQKARLLAVALLMCVT
jgi:hypothetical protein